MKKILFVAVFMVGCSDEPKVQCGKVIRVSPAHGGFWGTPDRVAVDLGDRVIVAGGSAALAPGDRVCVQLRGEGGPFVTTDKPKATVQPEQGEGSK